jgi:hypothetical protein
MVDRRNAGSQAGKSGFRPDLTKRSFHEGDVHRLDCPLGAQRHGYGLKLKMYLSLAVEYVSLQVSTPTCETQARNRRINPAHHRRVAAGGDRVGGRSGGLVWVGAGRGEGLG